MSQYGTGQSVKITWTATAKVTLTDPGPPPTQTTLSSQAASCSFIFTTAQPGEPDLWNDSNGQPSTTDPCGGNAYVIGQSATFWATPDPTAAATPDSYIYQLNGGNPVTVGVISTAASPNTGKISVTPTRMTNILTVTAVTGGANNGQPATCIIGANPPATAAADQDLTGDGVPDLLSAGTGTTGIASGLWLAPGQGSSGQFDGTVAATATDLAPYGAQAIDTAGNGIALAPSPAGWDGMKAITGQFGGPGFNDIEAYYPGSAKPGIYVIPAQGDGSAATSVAASQGNNLQGALDITPFLNCSFNTAATPDYPLQLANAYDLSANSSGGIPDQIGVYTDSTGNSLSPFGGQSGFLAYFQADSTNSFDSSNGNIVPYILQNPAPSGTNWSDWDITTASAPGGAVTMFLHNRTSGGLYLWNLTGFIAADTTAYGCASDGTWIPPSAQLAGSPVAMTVPSSTWPTGTLATLQATTINGGAGLITVTSSGQVQSWAVNSTNLTAVGPASQQLSTTDHSYPFADSTGTAVTDYPGAAATDPEHDLSFHLGTTGSVAWNTGSMFSPDIALNEPKSNGAATSGGYLTTTAADFSPTSGFTISAWVNPSALGGTVFSQSGSSYSTLKVGTTTGGQWSVSLYQTGSTYTTVAGGAAKVGLWTQITVTYDGYVSGSSTQDGVLRLYANGTQIVSFADTSPPSGTGAFLVGASLSAGTIGNFLSGEVGSVQVWDSLAVPVHNPGPASTFTPMQPVRILDTRGTIGGVTGPVANGATIALPIAGANGIPATAVTAVAVAVTATAQTGTGYLGIYPDGEPGVNAATVNFTTTGGSASNDAIIPLGPDGKIAVRNNGPSVQVIVDVDGYFSTSATGSTYHPLGAPSRIIDTIAGIGVQANGTTLPAAQIPAGTAQGFKITNTSPNGVGIPPNATAVVLNVSAIAPAGDDGFIIAYPNAASRPTVSQLQFHGSQTYQDTIIIPVSATVGTIYLYNGSPQPIDLRGDLSGYFMSSSSGQYYHSLDTTRLVDTRQTSPIAANGVLPGNVPVPAGIAVLNPTLILNVTATNPGAVGPPSSSIPAATTAAAPASSASAPARPSPASPSPAPPATAPSLSPTSPAAPPTSSSTTTATSANPPLTPSAGPASHPARQAWASLRSRARRRRGRSRTGPPSPRRPTAGSHCGSAGQPEAPAQCPSTPR